MRESRGDNYPDAGVNFTQLYGEIDMNIDIKLNIRTLNSDLKKIIEENFQSDGFGVPMVSELLGISERTLHRTCTKHLSKTPSEFILKFKIDYAKKLLLNGIGAEKVYKESGFNSYGAFRLAFMKETGINPSQFVRENKSIRDLKENTLRNEIKSAIHNNYLLSDFDVKKLAELLGLTQRTLHRHCIRLLENNPATYINNKRIKKSIQLLENEKTLANIENKVGFKTERAFRAAFKRETGTTPIRYLAKLRDSNMREINVKIHDYLMLDISNVSEKEVKFALRDRLNIFLPQRRTLIEAIAASASDHEILGFILEYYQSRSDSTS